MEINLNQVRSTDKRCAVFLRAFKSLKPYFNLGFDNDAGKLEKYYRELFLGGKGTVIYSAESKNGNSGFLIVSLSKWDSEVFGVKVAIIGYLAATGSYRDRIKIKSRLVKEALRFAKNKRIKFLLIRADANDLSSVHSLERNGFKIMDNLVTYIYRKRRDRDSFFRESAKWFRVSRMRKSDLKGAGDLLVKYYKTGHHAADPLITDSQTETIYRKWLADKFKDRKNSDVFVAKRSGKIIGCSIFSINKLLQKHSDLKSLHRGLVAVEPSVPGCVIALINAQIKKRKDLDFAEFETQGHNYKMLNVIHGLGMRLISSRFTLHRWL